MTTNMFRIRLHATDSLFKQPKPFQTRVHAPRHDAPGFLRNFPPFKSEGAGNAGCPVHPQPRVRMGVVKCTRVFTASSPQQPGIPARNGFNGCFVLSPAIGSFATVASRIKVLSGPVEPNEPPRDLTPASRRQDHTTSPSASAPPSSRARDRSRRSIRPAIPSHAQRSPRPPHLIPRP
jgi:hypothetical protein